MASVTSRINPVNAPQSNSRLSALRAYLDGLTGRPPLDELLEQIEKASLTIEDVQPWIRFSEVGYSRNLLWEGEHYEALVLCWKCGQHSPIHDHAGSICGLTILQGKATETLYEEMPCGVVAPLSSGSKTAGECCSSQDSDTHVISNYEAEEALVTLHIYIPKLGNIGIFDAEGRKSEGRLARFLGFTDGDGI